ncbi:amino acid adenylation domain-containing protein [Polymorphospora sp. NPDC051019]|uniref:amino acid adenylation domain-containing protein n=1 Tax=Polymorphospora sp. NPDC051019 TaxID=3155725 RepID=UPI00342DBC02
MTASLDAAQTLHGLVAGHAVARPDACAVECGSLRLTYAELDDRATALAARLRAAGTGPEDIVGVRTARGPELVVAILGVLKAGAAYLPLTADLPPSRVAALIADAGVRVVVAGTGTATAVTGTAVTVVDPAGTGPAVDVAGDGVDPDTAAYVIYTSGSTGVPKGVVVEHRAAAAHIRSMVAHLGLTPDDVVLQMAGHGFDVAVEQLFAGLAAGARVVLRDDRVWGPAEVCAALRTHAVTVADLPTALFTELATARHAGLLPAAVGTLRAVLAGGEALPAAAVDRWRAAVGPDGPPVLNAYGPTETAMTASVHRSGDTAGADTVPIGAAVGPRVLHVLDADLAGTGGGELYIGGTALARGYLGRPDLTAERFVPDPWGPPGARMYRTGDRVRRADDAADLTFLGRVDDQVKVRGFRIEPAEIEAVLAGHPDVAQAAVLAGGGRLTAYLAGVDGTDGPEPAALTAWLTGRLPAWMVPAVWHRLDRLPVTPGGKVDRAALAALTPAPAPAAPADTAPAGDEPADPTTASIRRIWARVLDLPGVGVDDTFLDLGGTSLLAARIQADLRADLGVELPLHELLANPTVAALAPRVEAARAGDTAGAPALPELTRYDGDRRTAPLSVMQEQIWFFEQLTPGNVAYNAPTTIRLHGPVDVRLLEAALSEVVRRHEILRTTVITRDGDPVQLIHPPYRVRVATRDLRYAPDPAGAAEHVVAAEIRVPFDVSRLPLLRWLLLRLADEEYELVLVEHHIIHDGWSFAVLMDELLANYAAVAGWAPAPAEPRLQYLDFVHWQRAALPGPALRAQFDHWADRLAGAPDRLDLPYDHPRSGDNPAPGAVHRAELPADLCAAVREFSRRRGVTLFITMMAGYAAMLHRFTGQDELSVGSAYGNRAIPGTEGILGMFVNPVVLRLEVPGRRRFTDVVDEVRAVALDAQAHQHLPFVHLVRELAPPRRPGHNPMFAAMMNFDDAPLVPLSSGPISASYLERHNGTAKLDLSVLVVPRAERQIGVPAHERDQRITMIWEYRSDLFDPATIARFFDAYVALLRAALTDPARRISDLPMSTAAIPAAPAAPPATGADDPAVHRMFARVAADRGDAEAVLHPGVGAVSYAELDRRANRFAHLLRDRGVGTEDLVAICLPRGVDWVSSVLGVLKAGAAYLPLDPDSPADRLAGLLADAGPRALVTVRADLPGTADPTDGDPAAAAGPLLVRPDDPALRTAPEHDPGVAVDPDQLAYLIYTSGSTGRPKAVGISHRALASKYAAWRSAYDLDLHPGTHLQLAALAFDVCTGDVVRALLSGGRLVLCPPEAALEPAALLRVIREYGVDTVELLPSVMNLLASHLRATGSRLTTLRLAAIGGEAWTTTDHRRFREVLGPNTRLLNVYGVTEVTIGNTLRELGPAGGLDTDDQPLPIGEPLPEVEAYVLDAAGRPVPVGAVGEVFLGGVGVARGYHGRPDLTAERFRPDPSGTRPGARLYATGDRGRFRPDGGIEFLGRIDHQVKIRGFRVEPGEVEHALRGEPSVGDAVVVAHTDRTGVRLVGYVTGNGPTPPDPANLRDFLRGVLPAYLVPAAIQVLPELPRTTSGKVDRRALPDPGSVEAAPGGSRPPTPGVEQQVADVWCEVLGLPAVGADDDFFDLGGHSLLAAQVTARLLAVLGVPLSVRDLLAAPTVAGLARRAGAAAERTPARTGPALVPRARQAFTVAASAFDDAGPVPAEDGR